MDDVGDGVAGVDDILPPLGAPVNVHYLLDFEGPTPALLNLVLTILSLPFRSYDLILTLTFCDLVISSGSAAGALKPLDPSGEPSENVSKNSTSAARLAGVRKRGPWNHWKPYNP